MKVVLDTNAFYAFMEISKDSNIKKDRFRELMSDPNNESTISTATIYEFLVKHENNIDAVKNGISFIGKHIKKIHSYGTHLPLTEEIKSLQKYSDKKICEIIKNCKERKIEIESRYSALFLGYLLFQYTLSYLFEEQGETVDKQTTLKLFQRWMPQAIQATQTHLEQALRDGYNMNNAQKVAEDKFNSLLIDRLSSWLAFLEFINGNPKADLGEDELFSEYLQIYNQNPHTKKFRRYADNINKWIAKYDDASKQIASTGLLTTWRSIFEAKGVQGVQLDYMEWKLSSMSQQKTGETPPKFRKNDISDMLILTVLNDDDSILITFDKNMRKFISHIKNKSESYINNIYSIPI